MAEYWRSSDNSTQRHKVKTQSTSDMKFAQHSKTTAHQDNTSSFARWRRKCVRNLFSVNIVLLITIFSIGSFGYWIYEIGHLERSTRTFPTEPDHDPSNFRPYNSIDVRDVLFQSDLSELAVTHRNAIFIFCKSQPTIDYITYLSMASVVRFFGPQRLFVLYEGRSPPLPGNWTIHRSVQEMLTRCRSYRNPIRMKNSTLVCSDPTKMHEFIMKLMLQYGGIYVGKSTFLTETSVYLQSDFYKEKIFYHLTEDCEGFVYVREKLGSKNATSVKSKTSGDMNAPENVSDTTPEVRYFTSREVRCLDMTRPSSENLHDEYGSAKYICVVSKTGVTPENLVSMKSDFGDYARKAVYDLYDDWEAKYVIDANNLTLVPTLCVVGNYPY